jgi:iron complex transport system substrate-binding protein
LLAVLVLALAACTSAAPSAAPTAAPTAPPSAAATSAPTAAPAFPVTVTDDEGTEVTIAAAPQKIVSLTPATTETLFAIGAGSRVVAKVEDLANFPPEAGSLPVVATFNGVDIEKIVDLGADLVVSGGTRLTQGDAVEQLRRANIPVIVSYPQTVDAALASIELIGTAVGASEQAGHVLAQMREKLDRLAGLVADTTSKPRVFYEIDVTGGIFTPPANSIYGEMFKLAGAEPISGDASYSISLEELVAADPEVILLGDGAYGVTADQVKARTGWGGMTAVKAGRIIVVDDVVITRPGPRIADGLEALIKAIHPELVLT